MRSERLFYGFGYGRYFNIVLNACRKVFGVAVIRSAVPRLSGLFHFFHLIVRRLNPYERKTYARGFG